MSRRIDPETAGWRLTGERMAWLTASMVLVLAPHAARVPLWISGLFAMLAVWRMANVLLATSLPPRWVIVSMSLLVLPGVYWHFGTITGRLPGVALLVFLAGMKLLETRSPRDAFVVCFLGYFLVITNFLFSQSIPTGLYMLLVLVVMTATLASVTGTTRPIPVLDRARVAARMLAQAAPIALVLFVVFPRIAGPLWGLPKDAHNAASGLSDTMSPGNISSLGLSDAVAFRVNFDGPPPAPGDLYWRGPVLWHTDGRTWQAANPSVTPQPVGVQPLGEPFDHEIILEPHQRRWLFALDAPVHVPARATVTPDLLVYHAEPVRERMRYRMRSYPARRLVALRPEERRDGLALPANAHPRARALARTWRDQSGGGRALVERALAHFRAEPFYYTLRPPLLPGDSVDEFLFGSRSGFCEHYASAFTVLMRAGGVPARVVTGYQGGEVNPLGDYLLVRQRDAHAWAEVWLDDEGWVRVDPTAAVAPSRIEQGMDAAIPPLFGPAVLGLEPSEPVQQLWRRVRQSWDAVNHRWNEWVLGYGPTKQRDLLARWGLDVDRWLHVALVLLGSIAGLLALVALWMARARRRGDAVTRLYERFCARLARAGLARAPHEAPNDFAERVSHARPALAEAVRAVTALYVAARYEPGGGDVTRLRKAVAGFKP